MASILSFQKVMEWDERHETQEKKTRMNDPG